MAPRIAGYSAASMGLSTMSLIECTAAELQTHMEGGDVSAEEIARAYLDAIEKREPKVDAFLHLDADAALEQARTVDRKRAEGKSLGKLAGLPVAVKDVLLTSGDAVEQHCCREVSLARHVELEACGEECPISALGVDAYDLSGGSLNNEESSIGSDRQSFGTCQVVGNDSRWLKADAVGDDL